MTETNHISFSHVRRIGNSVAHTLAKHARHVSGYMMWMKDIPPHFHYVLEADVG